MKKTLYIIALLALSACSSSDQATRALQAAGYKDINITGYSFFGCDEKDSSNTRRRQMSQHDTLTLETTRAAFERYFLESRKSKGANRKPTFERFEDGTYKDDHTQRHWWTWQNAIATPAQAQQSEPAKPLFASKDSTV